MGYEVDFLAVGEESRSGDAIALRWGNLLGPRNEQQIVVVDGGSTESGKKLVEFVKSRYQTDTIDLAVLSHPDQDHASGMYEVVEGLKIRKFWMHRPWQHAPRICEIVEGKSAESLADDFKADMAAAWELDKRVRQKGLVIEEPFAGSAHAGLRVLGPTKEFYLKLLVEFGKQSGPVTKAINAATQAIRSIIKESWNTDGLAEPVSDATTHRNNSSTVLYFESDTGKRVLLTGDSGVPGLSAAIDYAASIGIKFPGINCFQVPHHGSKRNVGPSILSKIIGPIQSTPTESAANCFISAAKKGMPKHPSQRVINALKRRGCWVKTTQGANLWSHHNAPLRTDYNVVASMPFVEDVQEEEE